MGEYTNSSHVSTQSTWYTIAAKIRELGLPYDLDKPMIQKVGQTLLISYCKDISERIKNPQQPPRELAREIQTYLEGLGFIFVKSEPTDFTLRFNIPKGGKKQPAS